MLPVIFCLFVDIFQIVTVKHANCKLSDLTAVKTFLKHSYVVFITAFVPDGSQCINVDATAQIICNMTVSP